MLSYFGTLFPWLRRDMIMSAHYYGRCRLGLFKHQGSVIALPTYRRIPPNYRASHHNCISTPEPRRWSRRFWKLSGWGPHLEVASHVILSIGARAFLVVVLRCHLRADWQWCCAYRLGSGRLLSPCLKASLHPCLQFFRSFALRLVLRRYRSTPLSLTPLGAVIATLNWCIGTLYIPASLDPTEHNKYAFLFERVDRFFTYAI